MLRLRDPQGSLWDQLLPIQVRRLSAELTAIDTCLADERFFEPYLQRFNTLIGRPTVPVETYLRLMYLKHRYRLGYETLVKEVTDSLHWRRFCHLALDAPVPHATTLSKLTRKYGPTILHDLNRALVQRACEAKLVRCRKLRVDTTVVQAPIDYPTDIGLLADSARVVTRTVRHLQAAGVAARTTFRSRARRIKHALATVGRSLRMRTEEAKQAVLTQTARVLAATNQIRRQAERVLRNSRHIGEHIDEQTAAMVKRTRWRLRRHLALTAQVVTQARTRLTGTTTIPDRIVSVFDPEARPIRRGKLGAKTEFGYKALLTETEDRLITHYEVHMRNPDDGSLLPATVALRRQRQARQHAFAVEEDRAGPARPLVAAFLRAGQGEVFPQRVEQCDAGLNGEPVFDAVHHKEHRAIRLRGRCRQRPAGLDPLARHLKLLFRA